MQIRCFKCQMPIALGREALLEAWKAVESENLSHYDVRCPKCRTVNRVSRQQIERAARRIAPEQDKE